MAFESDFLDCMPFDIVHRVASTTANRYGKISHVTAASTYAGLIQYEDKMVRSFDGTDQISTHNVLLNATGTIEPFDLLTLPDGTAPPILSIAILNDNEGQHHVEVFFGSNKTGRSQS